MRYTPNRVAKVPTVAILRIDPCARYVQVVHMGSTIIRRGPEVAVRTLPARRTTGVVPGDRRRQERL